MSWIRRRAPVRRHRSGGAPRPGTAVALLVLLAGGATFGPAATSLAVAPPAAAGVAAGAPAGAPRLAASPVPAVSVSPTEASAPSTVTLSASGFNPQGGMVVCRFTAGMPASSTHLTVFTDGTAAGPLNVTAGDALGTNPIVCTQQAPDGSVLSASATFRVTDLETACPSAPAPPATATGTPTTTSSTCAVGQVLATTVSGTDLSLGEVVDPPPGGSAGDPTVASVPLSAVALGGAASSAACGATAPSAACGASQFAVSSGHLDPVVVEDNRGNLSGWTVTGQMLTTFVGPEVGADHVIPASFLTWLPSVGAGTPTSCVTLGSAQACGPSDDLTQIAPGPAAHLSTTTSRLLCQAATGGGGGSTRCTAALYLAVPPYVAAGRYSATLDIVIS